MIFECTARQPQGKALIKRCSLLLSFLVLYPSLVYGDKDVSGTYPVSLSENVRYLVESDQPLDIQQARVSEGWASTGGQSDFGWVQPTYWFHVYLTPYVKNIGINKADKWIIQSPFAHNDFIDAYFFHDNKMISHQINGDGVVFDQRSVDNRLPLFEIPSVDSGQLEVYFRVETEGSMKLPLNLWPYDIYKERDRGLLVWHGFFIGASLIMIVYNVILLWAVRDVSSIAYILYLFTSVIGQGCFLGWAPQFIWPNNPELTNANLVFWPSLSVLSALVFTYHFLELGNYRTGWKYTAWGLMGYASLSLVASLVVPYQWAILVMAFGVFVVTIFDFCAGVIRWIHGMRTARFFCMAWISVMVGVVIAILAYAGIFPVNLVTNEALIIGAIIQMALHSLAFGDKFNETRQARILASAESETKIEFIAKMSHEIRTPMNGVLGLSELLRATKLNRQQKYYIDEIYVSGRSLVKLINDVLDLSKLEADKMELESLPFDLRLLVAEVVSMQKDDIAGKNIQLDFEVDENVPSVLSGDTVRLGQILHLLLEYLVGSNRECKIHLAVKAMKIRANSAAIQFEIKGNKLNRQVVKMLCSPEPASLSTAALDTVGVGLIICKQLVDLMNGSLGAYNKGNEGFFWCNVELPITDEYIHTEFTEAELGTSVTASVEGKGVRILVAEDNKVNQLVIDGFLKQLGCEVMIVNNGLEAVDAYRNSENGFDMIFMDCEMPEMDGFEASEYIRLIESQQGYRPIPIVALSAHAIGEIRSRCQPYGMNEILTKPVSLESISGMLRRLSGQSDSFQIKSA